MGIITKCSLWWKLDNTSLLQGFVHTAWQMSEVQTPPHHDGVPPHPPCIFQRGSLLWLSQTIRANDPEGRVSLTDWVFCVVIWQRSSWRALSSANPLSCAAVDSCSLRQAIRCWQDLRRLCSHLYRLAFSGEFKCRNGVWLLGSVGSLSLVFCFSDRLTRLSKCYDSAYTYHSVVHHCQPASQHEQEAHSH